MFADGAPVYAYVLLALAMLLGLVPALLLEVFVLKSVIHKHVEQWDGGWNRPIAAAAVASIACVAGTTAYLLYAGRASALPSSLAGSLAVFGAMTLARWVIEFGAVRREPAKILAAAIAGTLMFILFEPVVMFALYSATNSE